MPDLFIGLMSGTSMDGIIEGKPGNLPAVTCAARPAVPGRVFRKR